MIRIAINIEQKKKCLAYLRKNLQEPYTDRFLYICKDDKGTENVDEVVGVAGITIGAGDHEIVGYLEPFIADNKSVALKLFCGAEGYCLAFNCNKIIISFDPDMDKEKVYERLGFQYWSKNLNQFIKFTNINT